MSGTLADEGGLLESGAFVCWAFSCGLCIFHAVISKAPSERLAALWIGWGCFLCGFRELDGHILLNPQVIGEWGVRYRIDWWLNPQIPAGVKLMWAAIGCAGTTLSLLPGWNARVFLLEQWRRAGRLRIAVATAVGLLGAGYVIDDLFRGILFASAETKALIEECAEFLGAVLITCCLICARYMVRSASR